MSIEEGQWGEFATGKIRIGNEESTAIKMSRWHWRMLAFLQKEQGHNVSLELAELRQHAPAETPEQLVLWYVELSYQAILGTPEEERE